MLFWRLYMVLGVISAGAGVAFLTGPALVGAGNREIALIRLIGAIFLVFGIARIVNSVLQMRRLWRS